ncbi:MAG: pyruvate kinase [Lachnospiraceae bacterium]|nr:pyruvate kinase [Lachnospiraceae bacterium]
MKKEIDYYGTFGPACCREDVLFDMIEAGMTGIRLNLSHKSLEESKDWIHAYQMASARAKKEPNLLIDLIGPEIRIGDLKKPIHLREGKSVNLIDEKYEIPKEDSEIPVKKEILSYLFPGQILKLDDGKILLTVEKKGESGITCTVIRGGVLQSRKSLAAPGVQFDNPTLTAQDKKNIQQAKSYGVSAVMLPFVRSKEDLICLKETLKKNHGEDIKIFAKIENAEGINQLKSLLPFCDQIVIARGDLGNDVSLPKLPAAQQQITHICNEAKKPFMVVTQMLNSMIENPVPTRAEVNDIFHAITDGAASVMLTGETATGAYPVQAMKMLVETGEEACRYLEQ